ELLAVQRGRAEIRELPAVERVADADDGRRRRAGAGEEDRRAAAGDAAHERDVAGVVEADGPLRDVDRRGILARVELRGEVERPRRRLRPRPRDGRELR